VRVIGLKGGGGKATDSFSDSEAVSPRTLFMKLNTVSLETSSSGWCVPPLLGKLYNSIHSILEIVK